MPCGSVAASVGNADFKTRRKSVMAEAKKATSSESKLPLALILTAVGAVLFIVGAFLDLYKIDNSVVPTGAESMQMVDAQSGYVAIGLVALSLVLVLTKKFGVIAVAAFAAALGAILTIVINVLTENDAFVELTNGFISVMAQAEVTVASAGLGMWVALAGGLIGTTGAIMAASKK
jgi:hypothetical protein